MNLDEFEKEIEPQSAEDWEPSDGDTEEQAQNDLWDSIDLLEKAATMLDGLTEQADHIDIPARLELRAFRLSRKIRDFISNWDYRNIEQVAGDEQ